MSETTFGQHTHTHIHTDITRSRSSRARAHVKMDDASVHGDPALVDVQANREDVNGTHMEGSIRPDFNCPLSTTTLALLDLSLCAIHVDPKRVPQR